MKTTRRAKGLSRGLSRLVSLALLLALVLAANGTGVAQASPGPDSVTDSFTDEAMIASKLNLAVAGGQVQLDEVFSSGLYGGGQDDYFYSVYADGSYVYAAGYTESEGEGNYDALLVKFNLSDLSVASRKVYGGDSADCFYSVYADGSYVYAAGYTYSEEQRGGDALLVKFNKDDLNIASGKVYGGDDFDCFYSVYADGSYVYAAGYTYSEGAGWPDALLVKFDISNLSIASKKVYGGGSYDYFRSVYADGSYVYAAGYTDSEGAGESDALLVKFDISNLSIDSGKVYGGTEDDSFRSVYADGSYIYAAGDTKSEGAGDRDALLVKFNISNLGIASAKVYSGGDFDYFQSVYADGSYVYAAGYTWSEGLGGYDALLVKFDISDLGIDSGKVYGGGSYDYFRSVYADGSYVYAAGNTESEGAGQSDALLIKFNAALAAGTATDSCGLVCQDSGLTLAGSNLTLDDSNLTLDDSDLTLDDSTLTLADSALTLATCFSSGTLSSTNLLSGRDVSSIDSFGYNASSIPPGTGLKVQFSQDNTSWYSSSGTSGGWDTCTEGSNSIDLASLGWSGPNFYYKMQFTSGDSNTPVLDEISVTYSAPPPVGGEAYPVNKLFIVLPWFALGMAVVAGSLMALRRRKTQS